MTLGLLVTVVLVLVNGFFVATEFALVKIRASQLIVQLKQGQANAKRVHHILAHMDRYLSATQLGITLASLGLGWVGESSMGELIERTVAMFGTHLSADTVSHISFPIAFALLTALHILIGELLPKCFAIKSPVKYSLAFALPLQIFYVVFYPFIWVLQRLFSMAMHGFGIESLHGNDVHTEEEIKVLLTESEEHGELKASSNELIQNVFSFDDRQVRHIYTPKTQMSAVDIAWTPDEIVSYMLREKYSRYPVYEEHFDSMIGVLHVKDVMQHIVFGSVTHETLRHIMRPYHVVPLTQPIESLLHDMQAMHIHFALVQNEYGEIVGMVTMEDIIEELIGEVQDESDQEIQPYTILEDGSRMVQGNVSISDLNEVLPEILPESTSYDTLAGFLITIRGRIPTKGETIVYEKYTFRVESMRKHAIQTVHIEIKN